MLHLIKDRVHLLMVVLIYRSSSENQPKPEDEISSNSSVTDGPLLFEPTGKPVNSGEISILYLSL